MSKHKETENLEDQKEELLQAIDELRETLNLDDEDMETIRDWGVAILVTGISAYAIYQIIKKVFVKKEDEEEEEEETSGAHVPKLLKQQLTLFLAAFAKKKLSSFLESKGIMNED